MKLIDWLKMSDTLGFYCSIYIYEDIIEDDEDDSPAFCGSAWDIPWHLSDMYIAKNNAYGEEPISFRTSFGEEYNNRPGFVVCVTEKKKNAFKRKG